MNPLSISITSAKSICLPFGFCEVTAAVKLAHFRFSRRQNIDELLQLLAAPANASLGPHQVRNQRAFPGYRWVPTAPVSRPHRSRFCAAWDRSFSSRSISHFSYHSPSFVYGLRSLLDNPAKLGRAAGNTYPAPTAQTVSSLWLCTLRPAGRPVPETTSRDEAVIRLRLSRRPPYVPHVPERSHREPAKFSHPVQSTRSCPQFA